MVFSLLALASSHSPFAALLLLVKYLCLLVSLFAFRNDCGFAFLSQTWPSGCSVLICMSVMFEEFFWSSSKVLFPFQGALANFWFSFGCCGNIVNPSSLLLGVFLLPGICLRLRFLSCSISYLHCDLRDFYLLVLVSVVGLVRM